MSKWHQSLRGFRKSIKTSRFWKLQLSMSLGTQKYAKIPLPMGCGQDDLVLLLFLPFWRALAYKYPGGLIQCVRYKNIIDGPNSIYLISPICQCYPFVVFLVKTIVDVRCKKTSLLQVCVYASGDLSGDLIKSELFFGSNFWRVFAIWNHCVAWRESHYQVWISYHHWRSKRYLVVPYMSNLSVLPICIFPR